MNIRAGNKGYVRYNSELINNKMSIKIDAMHAKAGLKKEYMCDQPNFISAMILSTNSM